MSNNVFVGFANGQGESGVTAADTCHELQPITTWTREGNYQVTRRWRGTVDALKNFSDGGVNNKDFDGTYLSGTSGIIPGGAGRDGAISTSLQRDEGGQLGIFTATWVTSNLTTALSNPGATSGRTGTSGDQYQESSFWTLDGNDIEKSIFECPVMLNIIAALDSSHRAGFSGRVKNSLDKYLNGKDKDGNDIANYATTEFNITNYLGAADEEPLDALTLAQLTSLGNICKDYLKGVEAFPMSQYVLRNTKTVQYTSSIIPHYADVNKIWTTTQITTLMASETRPIDPPTSTVAYTLPLLGVLGTIFSTSKWLYRTPDVVQQNNGKWQITKEWWETKDYSEELYEAKT